MAIRFFSNPVRVLSIGRNPIPVLLIRSDPVRVLKSDPGLDFVNTSLQIKFLRVCRWTLAGYRNEVMFAR